MFLLFYLKSPKIIFCKICIDQTHILTSSSHLYFISLVPFISISQISLENILIFPRNKLPTKMFAKKWWVKYIQVYLLIFSSPNWHPFLTWFYIWRRNLTSVWHLNQVNFCDFIYLFIFINLFIYLFIFGCVGSSLLHTGFLQLR